MAKPSVQAAKEKLVAQILENTVYTEASGLYQRLRQTLLRLSQDDLANLALVISLKKGAGAS